MKRTQLTYSLIITPEFKQPPELAIPVVAAAHKPKDMYVLLYDLARFSELPEEEQHQMVERLTDVVRETQVTVGRNFRGETGIWYAPAGDGGALIFQTHLSALVWTFAVALRSQAARSGLDLHLGMHIGQMVMRPNDVPVGPAVLTADRASAKVPTGNLGVSRVFWEALRAQDREGWQVQPIEDAPDLLQVSTRLQPAAPQPSQRFEAEAVSVDVAWKTSLVEALLRCEAMSDHHNRDTVVRQLPEAIRQNIPRSLSDRVDIINIVTRCQAYPQGLAYLVDSIRLVEGDSPALRSVEDHLR